MAPESLSEGVVKVDAQVGPRGTLELLSQREVEALTNSAHRSRLHEQFRNCALAVLNTGSVSDDAAAIFATYSDFEIEILRRTRGLKLAIRNAPATAFINGRMIEGVRQHLFAVLRDIVFIGTDILDSKLYDLDSSEGITDSVFHILKHARVLNPDLPPRLAVCWGGHSIPRDEYDYSKDVGYYLGLRGIDICTGCGPGAMKGPMKGAAVGHAKQRNTEARYLGLTEPGIIAAEPPNPIVNHLVILPDIEKRLEAFLRLGHAIIVFPGGVGTAEEILYLFGLLLDPANENQMMPVIFTGPRESAGYFERLDRFLKLVLGEQIDHYYHIVIGDAARVGSLVEEQLQQVKHQRRRDGDAYYFNWLLSIPPAHQRPFEATHEKVAALRLTRDLPPHELAVELRQAFSALVSGNVKAEGIKRIERYGPFQLNSDPVLATALDELLREFVAGGRMKLEGASYEPCYHVNAI